MSGSRRLLRLPSLVILHFCDTYRIGVHGQAHRKEFGKRNVFGWIISFLCDQVQNIVDYTTVFITLNKVEFTNGFFKRDKALVVGIVAHDIRHYRGFSRACFAGKAL